MDKITVIISILQIIWIINFQHIHAATNEANYDLTKATYFGAPEILYSTSEITVNTDAALELSCKSRKPITWVVSPLEDYISYDVTHSTHVDDDGTTYYHTTLKMPSVEYYYVGYYYCINNKSLTIEDVDYSAEVDAYRASSIYLYVNDPSHLLAEPQGVIIEANQFTDFIIPCKPTISTVEVQLFKDDNEESQIDFSKYNPKKGYSVHLNAISDSGTYSCRVKDDPDNSFELHLTVHAEFSLNTKPNQNGLRWPNTISMDSNSKKTRRSVQKHSPLEVLTRYLNKPTITSATNEHVTVGDKISLNCSLEVEEGVKFVMAWYLPSGDKAATSQDGRILVSSTQANDHPTEALKQLHSIALYVDRVTTDVDAGVYKCQVKDNANNHNSNSITISVVEDQAGFLELYEASNMDKLVVQRNRKRIQLVVKYKSHPRLEGITWLNNKNELMQEIPGKKYNITQTSDSFKLIIQDIELADSGVYSLKAFNGLYEKEFNITIIIEDKPKVTLQNVYVKVGEEAIVSCDSYGYPTSAISWSFKPCSSTPTWPTCRQSKGAANPVDGDVKTEQDSFLTQTSILRFIPRNAGIITCTAKNKLGEAQADAELLISDIEKPFMIWGPHAKDIVVAGDTIVLNCASLVYNFTNDLEWYKDNEIISNSSMLSVIPEDTIYSHRRRLQIDNADKSSSGDYECKATVASTDYQTSEYFHLDVFDLEAPTFENEELWNSEILQKPIGETIQLKCAASGIPIPQITWYKDNEVLNIEEKNISKMILTEDGKVLEFTFLIMDHAGLYRCEATNKIATISRSLTLEVMNIERSKYTKIAVWLIPSLLLILLLIIVIMVFKFKKQKKFVNELKAAGLANFEDGNPDSLNPDLNLDEQADLLPYDNKFEFPRDKLKLGKQLGAGAFGVVIKAVAQGIIPYEEESTVAVKMVKKQTDNEVMKALISELKIMVHLGKHLNVVNLLGAVTKNIAKREVMVIVEYCQFGNIQTFLQKHRPYFIDQINPKTEEIDPAIVQNDLRWSHNSGYAYNRESAGVNTGESPRNHLNTQGYVRHSGMQNMAIGIDSCNTEATLIPDDDSIIHSNNVDGPFWCTNYGMDYKGPARSVTTSDLVCWGYQVARGMDYLASRKVLHGDLAARNILLCNDNVVKICDFGLARSMYKTDNYKKTGEAPLPFKWLALESISDHVFSTHSDVWAFGIVLWEMFSLAKVPYPGMDANQTLYMKLRDGYRMEKPQYANQDLYDIMLNCWNINPESRPQFSQLDARLGALLQDSVKDHYLDLNSPYMAMNSEAFGDGQTDYLALMGSPDQAAPAPPPQSSASAHYVNGNITPHSLDISETDYLNMTPKSGRVKYVSGSKIDNTFDLIKPNSPTIAKNLDNSPNQKHRSRKSGLPEETPMLYRNNSPNSLNSDSDSDINSPNSNSKDDVKFKALNPEYSSNKNNSNLRNTADNYVNVPSTMNNLKNNDAFANPSYITINTVNERAN